MGVSNMCSSMAGGLTIIPGGVKSTAAIVAGARTQWANFYNALFLILYIVVGRDLINMMPLSALGAIVIFTGYKLCAPKVWKHVAHIGGEQLFVFAATVLVTVTTDLLWGIFAGMLVKLLLEVGIAVNVEREEGRTPLGRKILHRVAQAGELFRNPVVQQVATPEGYHLYFARPLVCFNTLYLSKALAQIPSGTTAVYLHVTDLVTLIDHTTSTALIEFVEEFKRSGRGIVEILGLERLRPRSHDRACMRISPPIQAQLRTEAFASMARLNLSGADVESVQLIDSLAHFSLVSPTRTDVESLDHPITSFVSRAASSFAANATGALAFVRATFAEDDTAARDPYRDLCSLGLSSSARREGRSEGGLAVFSLTGFDHQSRVRRHPDRDNVSWTWAMSPGEN
jgi:MFS superfamily sulfate permease-like transporter